MLHDVLFGHVCYQILFSKAISISKLKTQQNTQKGSSALNSGAL